MVKKTKKKKHILLISPWAPPNIGGVETHLEDLYEYLRKNNYRVTLLTYNPLDRDLRGFEKEEKQNLTIYRFLWYDPRLFMFFTKLPPIFNFLYLTPYLFLRSFIFMLSYHGEIDVVHVFGLNAAFIGRILKLFFHKKTLMSFEALYNFNKKTLFGKICYWVLRDFDKILVSSEDSREDVLNLGLPKEKIVIYTHWINLDRFRPGNKKELKKKLGWEDRFTVLYAGRLIPEKGISLILEIAKEANYKDINFKIIGDDGPELPKVRKAAERLSNLQHLGKVSYDKMPWYLGASDIFLYPALYEEDLSRALLESLACGTPVINTNEGSGIYALKPSFSFVIKPLVGEIEAKIELLYKNPAFYQKMSKEAVKFAQKFGERLAKKVTIHY